MEMFDAHRRDILNFDNYMDLKKPGFGGPKSAVALRDNRGNKIDKNPKLDGYQRTIERDAAFQHPVYNPTYKAMTHDLVYKQEKKKPFTYDDTRTGIPVVEIEPLKEGKTYTSFERFVSEALDDYKEDEAAEYGYDDEFEDEREEDEIYDPIRAAHAEYESPMDRRYDAQRDEEGIEDDEEEFEEDEDSDLGDIENQLRQYEN